MARLILSLAFAALCASGAKTKAFRDSCVNASNQPQVEGATWTEGVNGCLKLTCTNGVVVGADSCVCTYPDGTNGKSNDVWYSIPTCQTCTCKTGSVSCSTLLNCILPTTTATVSATPTLNVVYTCTGKAGESMKLGDLYIDGCQNCTCTTAGLTCAGMAECPVPVPTGTDGQCFKGFLGFVDASVEEEYVDDGYVFTDGCNVCTCSAGTFACQYTCTTEVGGADVTVTETPSATDDNIVDDESAANDCDVSVGIVVEGDYFTNQNGDSCLCTAGELVCPSANTTAPEPTASAATGSCPDTNGNTVQNGGSYVSEKCTNCTCINGAFACVKVCERECKTSSGKIVLHGKTTSSTCSSCKCNDATLTCTNTCANQVCTIPNSKTTMKPNTSKNIDSCTWCKCSSTALLSCRNKCPTSSSCVCDGRMLKSGKSTTSNCKTCTCKNGNLTCKKSC